MTTANEAEYGDRRVKGESMDDRQWAEWQLSEEEQKEIVMSDEQWAEWQQPEQKDKEKEKQ